MADYPRRARPSTGYYKLLSEGEISPKGFEGVSCT